MEIPSIFLNRILVEAAKKRAVNLHLTVGSSPVMRIDGQLAYMENEGMLTSEIIEKIIDSFSTEEERQKLNHDREITLAKTLAGSFRYKINVFYQKDLPSITFRNIQGVIKNLNDLKLPKFILELSKKNSGLFIVSGNQSSGKTSTIASIIEEINRNYGKRIIALENPIEYLFISKKSIIEQRQIGRDVISYAEGLKYCLNEDANVVYVGEMAEDLKDVIPTIFELASGNALVIMEMNAENSERVLERIVASLKKTMSDEAARYLLSDVLRGILVQKLLPKIGGGVVLAYEMMIMNGPIMALIRESKIYQIENIINTSRKEGMISMEKCVEELVKNGEVKSEDNVYNLTNS